MTEPSTPDLAQRYGAPAPWRRRALTIVAGLVAAIFLVWIGWVAWTHGTPDADSSLVGFDVESDSSVIARVDVQLAEDVEARAGTDAGATCKVRAFAEDHTTVGEVSFTPVQGRNDVVVRTERRATSIELVGCVTSEQRRPR